MKLEYKILWVDDDTEGLEDIFDTHLKGLFEDLGFIMNLKNAKNEDELNSIIKNDKNFDFIFMDYNFDNEDRGINFIEKLRTNDIYANILFYSAQSLSELKDLVAKKDIQGLFIYYRPHILRDIDKIKKMIEFDLIKDLDINSMRGIAMAEVAEIDHLLLDIIKQLPNEDKWLQIEHNAKSSKRKYCEKLIKNHTETTEQEAMKETCGKILSICDEELKDSILDDPEKSNKFFPSSARAGFLNTCEGFNGILKSENDEKLKMFKKYIKDVIEDRNKLAHYKNPTGIDFPQLRKNIIEHKKNIVKILGIIQNHNKLESWKKVETVNLA